MFVLTLAASVPGTLYTTGRFTRSRKVWAWRWSDCAVAACSHKTGSAIANTEWALINPFCSVAALCYEYACNALMEANKLHGLPGFRVCHEGPPDKAGARILCHEHGNSRIDTNDVGVHPRG